MAELNLINIDVEPRSTLAAELNLMVRSKKHHLFTIISQETECLVAINLEVKEAIVPDHLEKDAMDNKNGSLVLKFSPRYGPKLDIMEEGICQTLTFQGQQFEVFASWDSIWGVWDVSEKKQFITPWQAPLAMRPKGPHRFVIGDLDVVVESNGDVDFYRYLH